MKTANIVVDCLYGDAGKGLLTHNLATEKGLVIRFSGGHQAGHTVIYNGHKHIFSSFGSATLKGVPSFFTEHTCFYLNAMITEDNLLRASGFEPRLFLHPLASATTPYDLAYNRATEVKRNNNKHGSCGMGIAATFQRMQQGYKIHAIDFTNQFVVLEKLKQIKKWYDSIINENKQDYKTYFDTIDAHEKTFIDNIKAGVYPFAVKSFDKMKDYYADFVFEGSQGIMLDKDHGIMPHCTFANTTSKNAIEYCVRYGLEPKVHYVARCYQTRHGAGPMSNEMPIELINTKEEINVSNNWQGGFRTGEFDYDAINYAIAIDALCHQGVETKTLTITCTDQRPDFMKDFDTNQIKGIDSFFTNNSPHTGNRKYLW